MKVNKNIINDLLSSYEVNFIEKHLVYSYIQNNGLDWTLSPILLEMFEGFIPEPVISNKISALKIKDLKLLENYLELLIPLNDRKVNGAFFTPTYVVDFIINQVSPKENDRCIDPSCGCGAFLIGLVEFYQKNFKKSVKNTIKENIFGSDILDYNIKRSKIILSLFGLLNEEIIEEFDFNLYHQDSLRAVWNSEYDIVVGNPPYVKFQDLSDDNRDYLIKNWESTENGTFNLYFAFFELGYKLLSPKGKLGFITPNNYFTSLAGYTLRQYFSQKKMFN